MVNVLYYQPQQIISFADDVTTLLLMYGIPH
jgi:hypothetical protein